MNFDTGRGCIPNLITLPALYRVLIGGEGRRPFLLATLLSDARCFFHIQIGNIGDRE